MCPLRNTASESKSARNNQFGNQFIPLFSYILHKPAAALCIRGADANTYLQGQFSNDLNGPVGLIRYGLWLNHKGRVLADSHLLKTGADEWLCFSDGTPGESLSRLLNDHIIADEVEVSDPGAAWTSFTLWPNSGAGVPELSGVPPCDAGKFTRAAGALLHATHSPSPGALRIWLPTDRQTEWLARLIDAGGAAATPGDYARTRIGRGIASVPVDLGANDLPQEGGLDAFAVSFTKGCYTGQEVMSRLKTRGQARRRLQQVRGPGTPPQTGAALFNNQNKVGEMRSSIADADGYVGLAMLATLGFDPALPLSATASGPAEIDVVAHE
jgi:hypothetical protein